MAFDKLLEIGAHVFWQTANRLRRQPELELGMGFPWDGMGMKVRGKGRDEIGLENLGIPWETIRFISLPALMSSAALFVSA